MILFVIMMVIIASLYTSFLRQCIVISFFGFSIKRKGRRCCWCGDYDEPTMNIFLCCCVPLCITLWIVCVSAAAASQPLSSSNGNIRCNNRKTTMMCVTGSTAFSNHTCDFVFNTVIRIFRHSFSDTLLLLSFPNCGLYSLVSGDFGLYASQEGIRNWIKMRGVRLIACKKSENFARDALFTLMRFISFSTGIIRKGRG